MMEHKRKCRNLLSKLKCTKVGLLVCPVRLKLICMERERFVLVNNDSVFSLTLFSHKNVNFGDFSFTLVSMGFAFVISSPILLKCNISTWCCPQNYPNNLTLYICHSYPLQHHLHWKLQRWRLGGWDGVTLREGWSTSDVTSEEKWQRQRRRSSFYIKG